MDEYIAKLNEAMQKISGAGIDLQDAKGLFNEAAEIGSAAGIPDDEVNRLRQLGRDVGAGLAATTHLAEGTQAILNIRPDLVDEDDDDMDGL